MQYRKLSNSNKIIEKNEISRKVVTVKDNYVIK